MKKKIISVLLIASVLLALSACNQSNAPNPETNTETEEQLFGNDTELNIVVGSHPSWPYNENWVFWRYFKESVGGKINVQAIPSTEFTTKVTLMMTSPDTLPDLLHVISKFVIDKFALTGAFVAIDDNLDKMSNYKKLWDSVPENERKDKLALRLSGDGKTYFPQVYGTERMSSNQTWMYRKDVFEKEGITVPETMEELVDVARTLKKIYPDSYPILINNYNTIATIGPEWAPYFQHYAYYDFDTGEWHFGAWEDTMRDIVEFFIKLREEGIVAPDFLTMNSKSWEELVSTDRGFIMPTYVVRIDFFNKANRTRNPDYTWEAMEPPRADAPNGQNLIAKASPNATGYAVCNTRKQERIDNAFKLLDWMYTDEAAELMSWGKKGETYEIMADGERRFLVEEGSTPREKYGALSYGLYQRIDPDVCFQFASDEQNAALEAALGYTEEKVNPKFWMAFSDEEMTRREELRPTIEAYTDEMIAKFIMKIVPLSEWDNFKKNLKDMGVDEFLSIHESAYKRVK